MKWKKLGMIFDLSKIELPDGYSIFAKSPQALVFDDYIRIYFCAQKKSENGNISAGLTMLISIKS